MSFSVLRGLYVEVQGTKPDAMLKWLSTGEASFEGAPPLQTATKRCVVTTMPIPKSACVITAVTEQPWHSNVVGLAPAEDAVKGFCLAQGCGKGGPAPGRSGAWKEPDGAEPIIATAG